MLKRKETCQSIVRDFLSSPDESYSTIGARYGISRQRVQQILSREGYYRKPRPLSVAPEVSERKSVLTKVWEFFGG